MLQLSESNWLAISYYLNLRQLQQILECAGEYKANNKETFQRCETVVMRNIFVNMFITVKYMVQNKIPVQFVFEQYLQSSGFIPQLKITEINNSQFGFVTPCGDWEEWNIANIELIRNYWCTALKSTASSKGLFENICKFLVGLLPGKLQTCKHCMWLTSEMYDSEICCYCVNRTK